MSFASLLNNKCNILARKFLQDSDTGENIDGKYDILAENIPCRFQNAGGSFMRSARIQTGSDSERLFLFPPNFEIKKSIHIIEIKGIKYNIDNTIDLGGEGRYMELSLSRVSQK